MEQHLIDFIEAHPEGWNHDEWLALVARLEENGFDVADPSAVGADLEKQRLAWELRRLRISGMGPKRIDAVAEYFGTLWSLRHAEVADFAEISKSVPAKIAEKVVAAVR